MTSLGRKERRIRKKGRRAIMIAYFVVVVLVIVICTVQVSMQAISRVGGSATDEPVECVEGIRSLVRAIDRARTVVDGSHEKEIEAVARYRASLEPEWSRRGLVQKACRGDKDRLRTLDAVVHLGFAEEHAVRRDAVELASFRRRANTLIETHIPPAVDADASPAP